MLRADAVGWQVGGMLGRRAEQWDGLTMTLTCGFRADPYNTRFFEIPVFAGNIVCPIMQIVGFRDISTNCTMLYSVSYTFTATQAPI
jgi:hypothetical protein